MALRNHEQYQHGVSEPAAAAAVAANLIQGMSGQISALPTPPALEHRPQLPHDKPAPTAEEKYTNGVLVEPIKTEAMKMAIQTKQTPFALLRPLNGIPVLVRVLSAGDKQMLVPATADDLRKHGQITIHSGAGDGNVQTSSIPLGSEDLASATGPGSTVQIKIPVVATVVQRCSGDGTMSMSVQSPGPKETTMDGYVVESGEDKDGMQHHEIQMVQRQEIVNNPTHIITGIESQSNVTHDADTLVRLDTIMPEDDPLLMQDAHVQEIHYLDERGNIITEEEYNAKTESNARTCRLPLSLIPILFQCSDSNPTVTRSFRRTTSSGRPSISMATSPRSRLTTTSASLRTYRTCSSPISLPRSAGMRFTGCRARSTPSIRCERCES